MAGSVHEPGAAPPRFVAVGADHRTAAPALRDRIFVADGEIDEFLSGLGRAGVDQALLLSTCDRIEVHAAHPDPRSAIEAIAGALAVRAGMSAAAIRSQLAIHQDDAALRRMFSIAASLESQVIGEPQVLGQVKDAHRRAESMRMIGPELAAALQAAYAAAKRVRSETAIAERPVSLAAAAVELARDVHGELQRCACLLLGPGEMGELMIEHLRAGGLNRLAVAGANPARAAEVARALSAPATPIARLADALAEADIVVAAESAGQFAITADVAETALRRRRRAPIFFIDLGVPADVDPAVERLDGAFRYDLDDLERMTMAGRATREAEAVAAWRILEEELAGFARGRAERKAVPAIVALRRHFEAARAQALLQAGGDAGRATELLVNRLLHAPSEALRRLAVEAAGDAAAAERLLAELFQPPKSDTSGAPVGDKEDQR
ncbi:MAG TPA: glutamyl-tRNA reductase [Alphaproteobacteria bacterium]|nr:glutamyl-tRNA reductase [Alphaproteobacteria bacterium]